MTFNHTYRRWPLALLIAAAVAVQGCNEKPAGPPAAAASQPAPAAQAAITVQHQLGSTLIEQVPRRVVALDMNEVDFLDLLGVPVVGMPKDFVPHFLARYQDAANVEDLGAIVQPNLERIHGLKPDLILITSLQANHYRELSELAPTLHFDVDYRDSETRHIEVIRDHLLTLGQIFGKQALAREQAAALEAKVEEVRRTTQGRPEKALVVLHNNGAFSSFGVQSRYGFIFNALGVKPASPTAEAGLHGQPISSEFIQQANPDIIYVVDRTAVMERRPVMDAQGMGNPLLRQTTAWKNGRVIFVDAQAWYVTGASPTSLKLMIDDVLKGYRS
ncbi:siderophore ABC transporter substrate-binding protein [Pseudomonas sp. Au-Pse12]|uniref:siderophore ABC transporter substrate-binding protein n=1 Tax=Pseudomonas sp. Au-Pse12 TaxID=2906459 RepID=UPI001E51636C|nr:siderophore ABC transporter substrate-binding protein [Pseudomonas sp. Au-Pse12]MCE4052664.1 siderophore ABC transporter substrate-binding protein [Pseudomonas sp. Au-Pse12]